MKLILTLLLLFAFMNSRGQITIDANDMPAEGQIYLLSTASNSSIQAADLAVTGANQNWNYNLTAASQALDTALSTSQTPIAYQFLFFGSDYAQRQFQDLSLGGTVSLTDIYNFYALSSSKLELSGFGALLNGLPVPAIYSPKDVIYNFPLNYGDSDFSNASFTIPVPSVGTWIEDRNRVNSVDGWGQLTTVLGTNNVLRVHSVINDYDSVYVEALSFGVAFPRVTHEYKWLAKGGQIPLLQVNTSEAFGNETISQIRYKDLALSVDPIQPRSEVIKAYPVPVSDMLTLSVENTSTQQVDVELFTVLGQMIFHKQFANNGLLQIPVSAYPDGTYTVMIRQGTHTYARNILVKH